MEDRNLLKLKTKYQSLLNTSLFRSVELPTTPFPPTLLTYLIRPHPIEVQMASLYCSSLWPRPEANFFDKIQTKVLRVFLLAIPSHLYSLAWDFYFFKLTQPLTVSTVQLLYTVKEKGGKPNQKPYPFPMAWKSIQKLSSLWLETSTKLYVHEFGICGKRNSKVDCEMRRGDLDRGLAGVPCQRPDMLAKRMERQWNASVNRLL